MLTCLFHSSQSPKAPVVLKPVSQIFEISDSNPIRENAEIVTSEKLQNESFPNYSNLRPEFCVPNFAPNFPRIFRGLFVLRFVGDGEQKKFTQNPCHFSRPNSQANTEKIFTKFFWRVGRVRHCGRSLSRRVSPQKNKGLRRFHGA